MPPPVKRLVDTTIAGKKVVIFSKSWCGSCMKAKRILKQYVPRLVSADQFEVIEIDKMSNCGSIQMYLESLTGTRSVPRVFINGKCIGGGDDTSRLDSQGKLKPMLTQ